MRKFSVLLIPFIMGFVGCDFPVTGASTKAGSEATNPERGNLITVAVRIDPTDPRLSEFRVEEVVQFLTSYIDEAHGNGDWHLQISLHTDAKYVWNIVSNYGLRTLGDKASIEYVEDKRPWPHYDHWHWYLVVNGTRIAEYEKVGGFASAAHDHIRLSKSWWDYKHTK